MKTRRKIKVKRIVEEEKRWPWDIALEGKEEEFLES